MVDYLDSLVSDILKTIKKGYYNTVQKEKFSNKKLKESILKSDKNSIISEIKFASPSEGTLRKNQNIRRIAQEMEEGGVVGISILTEPKHFGGNIRFISKVQRLVKVPILMKDIIIKSVQIDAAARNGASAVLLIQSLFDRGYCEADVEDMIKYTHSKNLEVLLEAHTEEEFLSALKTDADLIGINNRDLKTLKVDLRVTKRLLNKKDIGGKVIVSESGINNIEDIHFLKNSGIRAFLIGTAIMKASNIIEKVKELTEEL
jgi:indole-3-glycerol phosphate synthase